VTDNSVIYRNRNIVYCLSILNGSERWRNDAGGRTIWQSRRERQYPMEDILVQDGLVFTPMYKGGASLVALDEVTGQIRWAYGPMVASTFDEAHMRFEAAPAGGRRTVYAGYILDNIEGDTHTDTEYGIIAFESTTGRVQWRRRLCRLSPGEFTTGFATRRRNRIRRFASPPLYHQGTVYTCTNAGVIAALDALSGRVKWLMRYPYWPTIHDATKIFGLSGKYLRNTNVMPWYNQRPLVVGERLYVLPVDTRFMFSLDRSTGKVMWSKIKGCPYDRPGALTDGGGTWFLGPIRSGELVFVHDYRWGAVQLVDPKTGKTVWTSPDVVEHDPQPVMNSRGTTRRTWPGLDVNRNWFHLVARPFLSRDDRLIVPSRAGIAWGHYGGGSRGTIQNLCYIDLAKRKIVNRRRHYSGTIVAGAAYLISTICPEHLKMLRSIQNPDKGIKERIRRTEAVCKDHPPRNPLPSFTQHARITFERHGVPFELRFGARRVEMVYDRDAVERAIAKRNDPDSQFAGAELAIGRGRFAEAATLLRECLRTASSEDLDFRESVKQQLYRVNKELARIGIRAARPKDELASGLGMARTATTLADEIQTLFALSEAYGRTGEFDASARCLRSLISVYGHREYAVPAAVSADRERLAEVGASIFDDMAGRAESSFQPLIHRSVALMRRGLPLYFSAVSPLEKTLNVRTGELAASRLIALQGHSPEFAKRFETAAKKELGNGDGDEQLYRLWEFPGTPTAQRIVERLFADAAKIKGFPGRRRMWQLADAARICGLVIPAAHREAVSAPAADDAPTPVRVPDKPVTHDFADPEGTARLVLERRGQRGNHPHLLFIGGRVRKRLDNKFTLSALDLRTGKPAWSTGLFRLKGRGQEPGFFEAFVHDDLVVIHGIYDVLAFALKDGALRWRYRVPFAFEIREAVLSGELLILAGKSETVCPYLPTTAPDGEVVWRESETGDLYIPPYFVGDRLVSLRKMPFNVTARYRSTGKLIGRLSTPDLTLHEEHPLLDDGPTALPVAHEGHLLIVSDGWYYIALDTNRMTTLWKRLIDNNDRSREPAMRFALGGDYLLVTKEDYDAKTVSMLSSRTGEVLWHTDPKDPRGHPPMYSTFIHGDRAYGLLTHPGQGFYFFAVDTKTGKQLFRHEVRGYEGVPQVRLIPTVFGSRIVAAIQDRQDFELRVFDAGKGPDLHHVRKKGSGTFGIPGRVSQTVQDGHVVLMSRDKVTF
jgi:outer membrane protein assembly factor BamB